MSTHLRWLAGLFLLLACSAAVQADACIGGGGRRHWLRDQAAAAAVEYDFEIVRDPNAKDAELRIPRRMLLVDASTGSSTRVAMAGLALSAAFVGGGLWCMRFRGPRIPKMKLLGAGVLGVLLVGTLFMGGFVDATPPRGGNQLFPLTVKLGEIDVKVTIVETGDNVQLVAPPELADKIAAR